MSVNFYTGANNITVKNTLTDELKTSYDDAVELVNKLGADATVEGSVAQRLAAIVANAPEKYDTLKEIATWIESDTDGAAKMQADIAALEADKLDKSSVSSWAKASTKPDYTASEINLANGTSVESAIDTLNSKNEYFSYQRYDFVSGTGWYRIAKFHSSYTDINGGDGNSVGVIIKRGYSHTDNEYHELKLLSVFNKQEFRSIFNKSNVHQFTKMRYTINRDASDAYIEVYYSTDYHNICSITLTDRMSGTGKLWESYFERTEETVDGVIIRATFDIPSNDT